MALRHGGFTVPCSSSDELRLDTLTSEQAILFFESLLDCKALQITTGSEKGPFDLPEIGNPRLLGRSDARRGVLLGNDQQFSDWTFQTLVQAWFWDKGFRGVRDLRHEVRHFGKKVCDFALTSGDGRVELVECKRIHPNPFPGKRAPSLMMGKIENCIDQAILQLNETAKAISQPVPCRHVMIDVSAYHENSREINFDSHKMRVFGFEELEIQGVKESLPALCGGKVDRVSLCWRDAVFIDEKATALIHRSTDAQLHKGRDGLFKYTGWTVEGYPLSSLAYRETRVLSGAQPLGLIATQFNNYSSPETFFTVGPEIDHMKSDQ